MQHFQERVIAYLKAGWIWGDKLSRQIGACGVYCGFCAAFRLEQNRCFGCEWASRLLRKARESKRGCVFWECTQDKNVECCFQCEEFPCKTHYDPEHAVYTKQALDMWKELGKTGLTFWGKRKELEEAPNSSTSSE